MKRLITEDIIAVINEAIQGIPKASMHAGDCLSAKDPYLRAFDKIANVWTRAPMVRDFVFNSGIAQFAASLMRVDGIRLSHDQFLNKPAGASATPIHADQFHWPVSSEKTLTAWIPLQSTSPEMGAIRYFDGSHLLDVRQREKVSGGTSESVMKYFKFGPFPEVASHFGVGDVGFHTGWTFHRAAANTQSNTRSVYTAVMMEDGIRIVRPCETFPEGMLNNWCPGQGFGEALSSRLNPLLFPRSNSIPAF